MRFLFVCLLSFIVLGCAAKSGGSEDSRSINREVVTLEELQPLENHNVYEVLRRLRPDWLRPRGITGLSANREQSVPVYLDGVLLGPPSSLTGIMARDVVQLRRLTAAEATQRGGTGLAAGAIMVRTR